MSKILYFDCFSGASGDMVLGALLDAGLPLAELDAALGSLMIPGYRLVGGPRAAGGRVGDEVQARSRQARRPHDHGHRHAHAPRHHGTPIALAEIVALDRARRR